MDDVADGDWSQRIALLTAHGKVQYVRKLVAEKACNCHVEDSFNSLTLAAKPHLAKSVY